MRKTNLKASFSSRKFKRGGIATAITISGIIAAILLNMIFIALAGKYKLSTDLTHDKAFTLTQQSVDFLKNINKDVEIILLNDESSFKNTNEYFAKADSVLNQYSKYSDKIKLTYVDVVKNPTFVSNYPNENLTTNSIIVKSGSKIRTLSVNDIFDISSSYYGENITASNAEQAVTSALVYVTSEGQVKVAVVKGYGEQDSSNFENILKKNNYDVQEVSILTDEIPEDASVAVMFAPERDIDKTGKDKIEAFLNKGNKNLIYVAHPRLNARDNINSVMEKWDVRIEDGVVYETSPKKLLISNNLFYYIADYKAEDYTSGLKNSSIPVAMPYSKPITVLKQDNVKTLLECSESAGIIPSTAKEGFDFSKTSGPIAIATDSNKIAEGTEKESKVAILGSYIAFDEQITGSTSLNNSEYFINIINVMSGRGDSSVTIESKEAKSQEMSINAGQANMLFIFFSVIIPVAIIAAGVIVIRKRKNG